MENMIYCPKCGLRESKEHNFCINCGHNLKKSQDIENPASQITDKKKSNCENGLEKIEYFHKPVRRSLPKIVILSIITLGIYTLYLIFMWAKEINHLKKNFHYNPGLALLLTIVTLGIAGIVYEALFSFDLENLTEKEDKQFRTRNLPVFIITLNIAGFLLALTGSLFPFSVAMGLTATALIQRELNLFSGFC